MAKWLDAFCIMSTTPPNDRWLEVQEILDQVLDRPPPEREALVARLCPTDAGLRREVSAYLRYEGRVEQFLEQPLLDLIAGRTGEDRRGELLGSYRLDESIAEGGMGTVYRASRVDGVFERQVAVKILRRGLDTGAIVRGFRRERQILAGLTHESIIRLIDGGATEDGLPYLVMEDVEGTRLDEYCDRQGLNLEQRLSLFAKLCDAVQAAHSRLVVHCDLKPSNILVTEAGELKLLDFGIATILESEGDHGTGTLQLGLGTPPYASPEQHRGEPISTATDVYALGGILYRLLAGKPPVRADRRQKDDASLRPSEGLRERLETSGVELGSVSRDLRRLRGDLDLIVQKAMAVEPLQRYRSVLEFGDDVQRFLEHRPILAHPESFSYLARRFIRRHRITVALLSLFFASLLGGAIGLRSQLNKTVMQRDRAVALQELYLEFLEVVDPSRAESEVQALQTALKKLQPVLFRLAPEDRVVLLDRMGRVLFRLEYFTEASHLQKKALDLRRFELPRDPRLLAANLNNLALTEMGLGHDMQARELLKEVFDLHQTYDIPSEIGWLDELNNLALASEKLKPQEAEYLFRIVLEGQEKNHGRQSTEVATALNNLGQHLVHRGNPKEGIPMLEEAYSMRLSLLGEDHRYTLSSLSNLAVAWSVHGKTTEALELARGLLERCRRAAGNEHPSSARAMNTVAFILLQKGEREALAEAETLLREAIRIYRGRSQQQLEAIAIFERNLVAVLLAQGRLQAAAELVEDLLPQARQAFAQESWRLADLRSLEGEILLKMGDVSKARSLILENLDPILRETGESSPYSRDARRRVAELEAREGNKG